MHIIVRHWLVTIVELNPCSASQLSISYGQSQGGWGAESNASIAMEYGANTHIIGPPNNDVMQRDLTIGGKPIKDHFLQVFPGPTLHIARSPTNIPFG